MLKPLIILLLSSIYCQEQQQQQGQQYPSFPLNGTVTITGEGYLNVAPDTFAVAFLIQKTGDTPSTSLQNLIDSSKDLIKNLTSDNSINVTEIEQSIINTQRNFFKMDFMSTQVLTIRTKNVANKNTILSNLYRLPIVQSVLHLQYEISIEQQHDVKYKLIELATQDLVKKQLLMQKALKLATVGVPSLFFLDTVVSAPEVYKQASYGYSKSQARVMDSLEPSPEVQQQVIQTQAQEQAQPIKVFKSLTVSATFFHTSTREFIKAINDPQVLQGMNFDNILTFGQGPQQQGQSQYQPQNATQPLNQTQPTVEIRTTEQAQPDNVTSTLV